MTGIITDRDICIAVGTRNKLAGELTAGEIASKDVFTCKADDEIQDALRIMASQQVRRLPVVDEQGVPTGILSTDDIVAHGRVNKWAGNTALASEEIIGSLKRLYGQKYPIIRTNGAVI